MFTNWKLREELNQEVYFKIQIQKNTYLQEIRIAQLSSILCNKHLSINFQPPKKKDPKSLPKIHIKCVEVLEVSTEGGLHTSKPLVCYFSILERSFFNKGSSNLNRPTRFKLTALKAHASTEKTYLLDLPQGRCHCWEGKEARLEWEKTRALFTYERYRMHWRCNPHFP